MKKRYCYECKKEVEVYEETIEKEEFITCGTCAYIIAKLEVFDQ